MRLTLPEPDIPEKVGFTSENDIFGYKEFGERLANLVSNINEPLVITLDGTWGSGKSVFIKQWGGMIRQHGGCVVYFDAFGNDHRNDAFLAMAAKIHSQAKVSLGEDNSSIRVFLDKTKKAYKTLVPIGLAAAMSSLEYESSNWLFKAMAKMLKIWVEKNIPEKLQKDKENQESLEAFRDSLSKVSKAVRKKNQESGQNYPLVFIVDELDRCRPSFALEILEHIKHSFSVENVCFVLVTYLTQMEAIIKKTYGAETEAHAYLGKFYHLKIVLPEPKTKDQKQRDKYLSHLWNNLNPIFEDGRRDELVREEIRFLVNAHELSLREIEQVMTNVVLAAASAANKPLFVPPVVAGLCIMRQKYPDLYARAQQNNLTMKDVEKFLKIDDSRYESIESMPDGRDWAFTRWQFFVDPHPPQKIIDEASGENWFHTLGDRLSLLSIITNYIDNLPTPPSHSS